MEDETACTSDRYQVMEELIEGNNHRAYLLGILHARLAEAKKRAAEAQERAVNSMIERPTFGRAKGATEPMEIPGRMRRNTDPMARMQLMTRDLAGVGSQVIEI